MNLKGDTRESKIMFNNDGKGNYTNKISLPKTWIAQMGVTPDQREVIVKFEDNKIIIEKK
nr:AbrB/MazE/SpoVT family DNA-binding domain-containing protein [uncultured Fusobacterium sp.]